MKKFMAVLEGAIRDLGSGEPSIRAEASVFFADENKNGWMYKNLNISKEEVDNLVKHVVSQDLGARRKRAVNDAIKGIRTLLSDRERSLLDRSTQL